MVRIFSPGTIGNVGPGFDILGVAVDGIGDIFEIEEAAETKIQVTGRDAQLIPTDPRENTVTLAANALFNIFGVSREITVGIQRSLPSSGGLGASASSSVAGALGAAALLGKQDHREEIVSAALVAESYVAGKHLDNIAPCVYGGLTIVKSVDPNKIFQVPLRNRLYALLISPDIKIKTKDSRNVLPKSLTQDQWVKQMAQTTCLVAGFAMGDINMIREGLTDYYAEIYRSSLIPGFQKAKEIALQHGALGFSISGAGPSCFGLFESESSAAEAASNVEAGFPSACTVHIGPLSEEGAKIL